MTLQTLPRPIPYPGITLGFGNAVSAGGTQTTLDAAGEYEAVVLQAREAMTISHVAMRLATVTGSPTADIRIETLDSSGNPSGSLWAANTNIVTGTLNTNWTAHALTASASIAVGDKFAVKIAYNSGTSLVTRAIGGGAPASRVTLPVVVVSTGGSTVRGSVATGAMPMTCILGSSATAFYNIFPLLPVNAATNNAFNNTSSARRGVRFQVPFTCRVSGLRILLNAAIGDFNFAIYDDAGSELSSSSTSMDGDIVFASNTGAAELFFDNPVTLAAGTWYRLAIEPTSSTNSNVSTYTAPSAAYMTAMPGGPNWHYTTYVASSWTDTATDQAPLMDLLIDKLDDGAGGGGGASMKHHPGMAGGLNG